jgi:hypothetical protein
LLVFVDEFGARLSPASLLAHAAALASLPDRHARLSEM